MPEVDSWKYQFASDTVAGICPEVMQALSNANDVEFVASYGDSDDEGTERSRQSVRDVFGKSKDECDVHFVSSGTIANVLAVVSACQSFDGIACHPLSHLECDEANAVEHLTGGAKLLHVNGSNGKIDPRSLEGLLERGHGYHSARPRMISITQATEVGTVYTLDELRMLLDAKAELEAGLRTRLGADQFRMFVHMDGARFANAVAHLGCTPEELVAGVDILSFGGSKNGGFPAEAIVFFNRELTRDFAWRIKQAGQLISKMRYFSAPWLGLLQGDVWLRNARHANAQATKLGSRLQQAGAKLVFPVEANTVFVRMAEEKANHLKTKFHWHFYPFQFADGPAHRFVCNWQTSDAAIESLIEDFARA